MAKPQTIDNPILNKRKIKNIMTQLRFSTSVRLLVILIAILLPLALLATYAAQRVSQNAANERAQLISDTIDKSAARLDSSIRADMNQLTVYANRLALGENAENYLPRVRTTLCQHDRADRRADFCRWHHFRTFV